MNPIRSDSIQFSPVQSNPVQFNSIRFIVSPIHFNSPQSECMLGNTKPSNPIQPNPVNPIQPNPNPVQANPNPMQADPSQVKSAQSSLIPSNPSQPKSIQFNFIQFHPIDPIQVSPIATWLPKTVPKPRKHPKIGKKPFDSHPENLTAIQKIIWTILLSFGRAWWTRTRCVWVCRGCFSVFVCSFTDLPTGSVTTCKWRHNQKLQIPTNHQPPTD